MIDLKETDSVYFGEYLRQLPMYLVSEESRKVISYLDLLSDAQLCNYFANELVKKILCTNNFDEFGKRLTILTAANKGVPLSMLVAEKLMNLGFSVNVVVARKENKIFYNYGEFEALSTKVHSITNTSDGEFYLPVYDTQKFYKNTIIIDDILTTGSAINALVDLAKQCDVRILNKYVALWETSKYHTEMPIDCEYIDKLFTHILLPTGKIE